MVASGAPTKRRDCIFLSHSGEDAAAARHLSSILREADLEVWLDSEQLVAGDLWTEKIEEAIVRSTCLIVYVGPSGVRNWVGHEVRVALDRSVREPEFRLIPILGPGADPGALPLFLQQHHWLDCREQLPEPQALKRLIASIRRGSDESLVAATDVPSPFRGLMPFETEDARFFYGRDVESDHLVKCLAKDRFLAVVGDSGSGKSSLLRAGLIPALHRGRFSVMTGETSSWRIAISRPGDDPLRELAEALPQFKPEMDEEATARFVATAKEQLASGTEGLRNMIAALRVSKGHNCLLVIDQFEELFTLVPDQKERQRYIEMLLTSASSITSSKIYVVIALRADFYSDCWVHADFPRRIVANQFAIQRMAPEKLRQAIIEPLKTCHGSAEEGLVEALLSDVGDEPGNLPLLEHTLDQLWARRDTLRITNRAYQSIGRLQGAIAHYAEQVYASFHDKQSQKLLQMILIRLVQLGDEAKDTRRRVSRAELLTVFAESVPRAEEILARLSDVRLIVVGRPARPLTELIREQDESDDFVELAHETLIHHWPRMKQWIEGERASLMLEQRLTRAASEWKSSGRDKDALFHGRRLLEAEEWAKEHTASRNLQEFLDGSRIERARVERADVRRRWLWTSWSVALALILSIGLLYIEFTREVRLRIVELINRSMKSASLATSLVQDSLTVPVPNPFQGNDDYQNWMRQTIVDNKVVLQRDLLMILDSSPDIKEIAICDGSRPLLSTNNSRSATSCAGGLPIAELVKAGWQADSFLRTSRPEDRVIENGLGFLSGEASVLIVRTRVSGMLLRNSLERDVFGTGLAGLLGGLLVILGLLIAFVSAPFAFRLLHRNRVRGVVAAVPPS